MVFALVMVAFGETLKGAYRHRDRAKLRRAAEDNHMGGIDDLHVVRNRVEPLGTNKIGTRDTSAVHSYSKQLP